MVLLYILISTTTISFLSVIGALTLWKNQKAIKKVVFALVGLSTGTLLGNAFFHLLPEALEIWDPNQTFLILLVAFCAFFLMEKVLHWHHCHTTGQHEHTIGYTNLVGDAVHNFMDGLIIATTFSIDIGLGIAASIAIAAHEIPQELGDFGVLVYSGLKAKQAVFYNLVVGLTAVLGGLVGFLFLTQINNVIQFLLPIAAGGFIYISTSDLIPELKKEVNLKKSLASFALFICGIALMYFLAFLE